ncbi:ParB/RepB/Spo0J family partition protein [Corallincola platygyrae]|uniref:Probable chromosome-partitioning protein ParB n=1 Tax=Corallincola platygyrae TaxID=1193278 RepID=A0ABW4XNW3_9GAMM
MSTTKRRGLGRGLDALLSTSQAARERVDAAAEKEAAAAPAPVAAPKGEMQKLPIEQLTPGKYQPRKDMSPEALEELAQSIEAQGIIQPIVVRKMSADSFEIIAGERRWRASQLAGLDVVPCMVKDVPDEAAVAIALIENIQREDLNAMEEAIALKRLMTEFQLTHQETADAVGKSRTTVTNLLRLNNLNEDVKVMLEHGDIEMGHARALLTLEGEQQSEAARTVVGKGMTVREAERLVRKLLEPPKEKTEAAPDPNVVALEEKLSQTVGAKVSIAHNNKGRGKLVINYTSLDELDGILAHIK